MTHHDDVRKGLAVFFEPAVVETHGDFTGAMVLPTMPIGQWLPGYYRWGTGD